MRSGIFSPEYYLEDLYVIDYNDELYPTDEDGIKFIESVIDDIVGLVYPFVVYRGINTKSGKDMRAEDYDNTHWTTDKKVAEGFGDKIFVGLVSSPDIIDFEDTIRHRVMNPNEKEIWINNFDDVKLINTYYK